MERCAGSLRSLITNSREDRHVTRTATSSRIATLRTVSREMESFARQTSARIVDGVCISMGDHDFGYPWRCIRGRSAPCLWCSMIIVWSTTNLKAGMESRRLFQTNRGSVYFIMMDASVFGGIVENTHCQVPFDNVLLVHYLKWRYGVPLPRYTSRLPFVCITGTLNSIR